MTKLWAIPMAILILSLSASPQGKLTATASSHSVTLTWNASATAGAGYNVYRAATVAGPFSVVASPSATTYVDLAVTAGTSYSYEVSATCGPTICGPNIIPNSESALSAPISVTIPNPQPPGAPTGLAATVAVLHIGTQDKITATWSDAPGVSTMYAMFNSDKNYTQMNGSPTPTATGIYSVTYTGSPFNGVIDICDAKNACVILPFIG